MDLYQFFIFCAPNFIRYSKILVSGVEIKTFMKYFCELSSFILDTLERVVAVSIVFKRQNSASLNQQKVGLVTTAIAKCRSLFWIFYRKSLMESDISAWVLVLCYQKRLVWPNASERSLQMICNDDNCCSCDLKTVSSCGFCRLSISERLLMHRAESALNDHRSFYHEQSSGSNQFNCFCWENTEKIQRGDRAQSS